MFIGEAFVTAVIKKVVEKGFEYVEDQWEWQRGMKTELRKLQDYLPQISAVVKAAANIRDNDDLKKWLWQLRDAVYDAEDVLDDLEYLRLKKQVEAANEVDGGNSQVFIGGLSQSREKLIKIGNRAFKSDPVLKNLREVVRKLDEVAAGVGNFLHLTSLTQQQQQHPHQQEQQLIEEANRQTGSLPTVRGTFFRKKEMEEVVRLLTMDHQVRNEKVSLVSIVGHARMGKTTLVQNLYNDERIVSHFGLRIWIHVSNKFDVMGLTRKILEGATKSQPTVSTLDLLQNQLKEKLMASQRFLLVLDDAWNEKDSSSWVNLFAPLVHGPTGSKILLTTRMNTVAEMAEKELIGATMKPTIINLKGLEKHDLLLLLNEHAFGAVKEPNNYERLQSIGNKIAGKLGGSPQAAKVVGTMLNDNFDEEYWVKVLNNDISKFEEGEKAIMSAFELSFHHLPEHQRRCFSYCSVFPPHYSFSKDDLIYMWMAMGFIQQSSNVQGEMLQDIGSGYFDYLVKRSFLEPDSSSDGEQRYIINDLLHEMAKIVSRDECFMFFGDTSSQEIPDTVRHLSFINTDPKLLVKVLKQENIPKLRTLHLLYDVIGQEHNEDFKRILDASKGVRVLTVSAPMMEVFWNAVDVLTHLKYLRMFQPFSPNYVRAIRLPDSLSKMYNLQAINLAEPKYYRKFDLPAEMNNAINLRHLIPDVITERIAGVGRLISLMELVFSVEGETRHRIGELQRINQRHKIGELKGINQRHKIGELKGINQLRRLKIKGLENVGNEDEARKAELHCKECLKELTLEWSRNWMGMSSDELDEKVLDSLRPSPKIKELTIIGYMGSKSADWMEPRSVENLHSVKIISCPAWKQLLPLEKLPFLKHLFLRNMPALEKIDFEGDCFQQLEELHIKGLMNWRGGGCCSESAGANSSRWGPHLRKLLIEDCPRVKVLPDLPLSLKEIELHDCRELKALPELPLSLERMWLVGVGLTALPKLCCSSSKCSSSSSSSSSSGSSLSVLTIKSCDQLKTLAEGLLVQQHYLGALKYLTIEKCDGLLDLPVEGFQHLCSLEQLKLSRCSQLKQLAEVNTNADNNNSFLPSSLKELWIASCGELERSLPRILQGARSLSILRLVDCNNMTSLPPSDVMRTLTSLEKLDISDCKELVSVVDGLTAFSIHHLLKLEISNCSKLVEEAAAGGGAHEFTSVERLIIDDPLLLRVEPLRSLTSVRYFDLNTYQEMGMEKVDVIERWLLQNRDTLQTLWINSFSLTSLPASLKHLSSLTKLELFNAISLQSLPQLPHSLQSLYIDGPNDTLKERCNKDSGADWPNIKHISRIYIGLSTFWFETDPNQPL